MSFCLKDVRHKRLSCVVQAKAPFSQGRRFTKQHFITGCAIRCTESLRPATSLFASFPEVADPVRRHSGQPVKRCFPSLGLHSHRLAREQALAQLGPPAERYFLVASQANAHYVRACAVYAGSESMCVSDPVLSVTAGHLLRSLWQCSCPGSEQEGWAM